MRSATQAGILERLFLHPDRAYTVGELAELLGVTDLSVRRELYRMVNAGMVDREAVGRQSVFRASVASPLYNPMRELVERSIGVEPLLRELIEQTPGVQRAAIYGSWARGTIDAESDVDLLVVGDIDHAALVDQLMALQERAGREINTVWMRPERVARAAGIRLRRGDPLVTGPRPRRQLVEAVEVPAPRILRARAEAIAQKPIASSGRRTRASSTASRPPA